MEKTLSIGLTGLATSLLTEATLTQVNNIITIAIQLIIAIVTLKNLIQNVKRNKSDK